MQNHMISILEQPFPRHATLILILIGQKRMDFTSMEMTMRPRISS